MEKTYRVLCLFILTSGLFRLNAASSLPHSHRNYTQTAHNRITYSPNRNNSTTEISVDLRRQQSLLPSLQRPHQIRHYHHHQHPSKHNRPSAYQQSDDTAFYNRLPVNQRPSHPSTEHIFGTDSPLATATVASVHRHNMPRPSTQGPAAVVSHHFQSHHRHQQQHHQQPSHSPTRHRQNGIDTRTAKKHGADATDNNGMLVPLRINNNNNNSNRNRNNSHRKKSVPAAVASAVADAPAESVAFRASQTKITPVRDICFIFNMPKNCGMRLNGNKAISIQSDSGNQFDDAVSNALDALAAKDADEIMDLTPPTTDKSAFNERHLRSNKRSQRDGHSSSRSTSNNLNYDEKGDNTNDGWHAHHRRRIGGQQPTAKATASRESMLNPNDSPIIPGDLTKHKFETLGTHAGVAQAREEFYAKTYNMRNSTVRNLAKQHADFIDREALCKVPRPRVISIPLHPSQSYMPPCTILHRCNDDTGCCKSHTLKCVPKQYEIVTLYFIVNTIRGQGFIEEKHFHNHTECHCVDKTLSIEPVLKPKCQCPGIYEISYNEDNECVCDCSEEKSNECNSKKAGIEHFSIEDRRCILNGACTVPNCLYGLYNRTGGGCPTAVQRDID